MTTEEKAKAYDEAKKKMHEIITMDDNPVRPTEIAKYLFPELAESEDEKIRKALINFLRSPFIKENLTDEKVAPWITYLEKQRCAYINGKYAAYSECKNDWQKGFDACKNLFGPQKEWSEEDRKMCNNIIALLIRLSVNTRTDSTSPNYSYPREINWLKSLRSQHHWKPSEEQMDALEYFIQTHKTEANAATNVWIDYENLVSLRNDLKKL